MGSAKQFSRDELQLRSLAQRGDDLVAERVLPLSESERHDPSINLYKLTVAIHKARMNERAVILLVGAHAIKAGLSRYLVDLIERRFVTLVASNGAGIIHDYELATLGGTSEDVRKWLQQGQFGLWRETGRLNEIIREAASQDEGIGSAVGRVIEHEKAPHRELSVAAACHRSGIPLTCHVTIGADIIHAHPNCDGAAFGKTSYTDFLIFAAAVENLSRGVFLNVGSAVTGPEVFLKALSMARNVAHQRGESIRDFTTAVFDLVELPENYRDGPPSKDQALYYYRPWKTLLCRSVSDGGQSFYIQGDVRQTIPALWSELVHPRHQPKAREGEHND